MNLIGTKVWDGSRFVADVYLEDSAPVTNIAEGALTLSDAIRLLGVPYVLASSLGSIGGPQLAWGGTSVTSPYYGMLHDLRWYSQLEIQLQPSPSSPQPSTSSQSASDSPWPSIGVVVAPAVLGAGIGSLAGGSKGAGVGALLGGLTGAGLLLLLSQWGKGMTL